MIHVGHDRHLWRSSNQGSRDGSPEPLLLHARLLMLQHVLLQQLWLLHLCGLHRHWSIRLHSVSTRQERSLTILQIILPSAQSGMAHRACWQARYASVAVRISQLQATGRLHEWLRKLASCVTAFKRCMQCRALSRACAQVWQFPITCGGYIGGCRCTGCGIAGSDRGSCTGNCQCGGCDLSICYNLRSGIC